MTLSLLAYYASPTLVCLAAIWFAVKYRIYIVAWLAAMMALGWPIVVTAWVPEPDRAGTVSVLLNASLIATVYVALEAGRRRDLKRF